MAVKITAEFERIEEAENAATKIKSAVGIEKFTITRPVFRKSIDTPFVLPYPPVHGRDGDIMRPRGYGYDTKTGYFEPALSQKCLLHFTADSRKQVAPLLRNFGAGEISVSAL
jgi:hypothetical protein